MKKVFTSFAAPLLLVWYLLSVIGFGVHTCFRTGETYIATVATGFSCEELHPDKHHHQKGHTCCCCSHEQTDTESVDSEGVKSCCTSDFKVITLTGTRASDNDSSSGMPACHIALLSDETGSSGPFWSSLISTFHKARSSLSPLRDPRISYGVWRI